MADPFTAAAAAAEQARLAQSQSAEQRSEVMPEEDGRSSLFGGPKLPSIFNKYVMPGQKRSGVITKPPTDRQSRGVNGKPKFWDPNAKEGAGEVVYWDTGRPLKDTVFVLQTEYRFTPQEVADPELNLDQVDADEDKGLRGWFANGEGKKAVMAAIKVARLRKESEMVGWTLTVWRDQKVKKGEFFVWTGWHAELTPPSNKN